MPEAWFVRAPETLAEWQTCTLPCAGVTAWFALVERAGIRAGETVLIPSTGGVALFHREDWPDAIYQLTDNRGADHILKVIGGSHLGRSVQVAAVRGHICQLGAMDGFDLSAPAMPLMLKDVPIFGIGTGSRQALERLVRASIRRG